MYMIYIYKSSSFICSNDLLICSNEYVICSNDLLTYGGVEWPNAKKSSFGPISKSFERICHALYTHILNHIITNFMR